MKKSVILLSYICTLGVGIGLGALCTRSYFERRESDRADREIESMKMAIRTTERMNIEADKPVRNDISKSNVVVSDMVKKIDESAEMQRQYHTFSADVAEKEHPREEDTVKPYFIDIDDFDEPTLGYAKKELQYYMDDGMLVDESENMDEEGQIVSIIDTVGVANLESFENSLESCCYIRNEQLKEDYEISKVFGSYRELLGED